MPLPSLPQDKANHALYGAIIYVVAFGVLTALKQPATYYALAIVALFGVGKEIVDYLQNRYQGAKHGVEGFDAIATIAGGVVCAAPIILKGLL